MGELEEELTNMLYRHRQTLKSLRLHRIGFKYGPNTNNSWWRWAKKIHQWMSSSLEQIELKDLGCTRPDGRTPNFIPKWCCLKSIILQGYSNGDYCDNEDFTHWIGDRTRLEDPWTCSFYYLRQA
jgi:hypothetical protein